MAVWLLCVISGGMLLVLAMGRPDQIAWKYLRLCGVLTLAMLVFSAAWALRPTASGGDERSNAAGVLAAIGGLAAAGLLIAAPWFAQRTRLYTSVTGIGALAALAAGVMSAKPLIATTVGPEAATIMSAGQWIAISFAQVLAGLLIGSVTASWLLGHAYLTATRMTIAPLRRFARILAAAVVLRFVFVAGSLLVAWLIAADTGIFEAWGRSWMIVGMRAMLGLVLPAVFAYMVLDCVKLRSTQSATGILYFLSTFIYVGELASQHLLQQTGWPL